MTLSMTTVATEMEDRAEAIPSYVIVDPRGAAVESGDGIGAGVDSLAGKKIGVVSHGHWRSWGFFRDVFEEHLSAGHAPTEHQRWQDERPYLAERYDEIVATCDAAIVGLGNCGSCTAAVATAASELASRGLPVAVIVTAGFRTLAVKTLQFRKQGHVPVIALPASYEVMTEEEIVTIARDHVAQVEHALLVEA